jgi:hypothetical protein
MNQQNHYYRALIVFGAKGAGETTDRHVRYSIDIQEEPNFFLETVHVGFQSLAFRNAHCVSSFRIVLLPPIQALNILFDSVIGLILDPSPKTQPNIHPPIAS